MTREMAIVLGITLMISAKCTTGQSLERDLPPLIEQGLEELITGKYLNALLDFLLFERYGANVQVLPPTNSCGKIPPKLIIASHSGKYEQIPTPKEDILTLCEILKPAYKWTPDLFRRIMAYLNSKEVMISIYGLQNALKHYLEDLLHDPKLLLSELRQINSQQFQLAMRYLFSGQRVKFGIPDVVMDFELLRERILQSPGGLRSLFHFTLDTCLPALNTAECVEILSQLLRLSSGRYLQPGVITRLPGDVQEEPFRNLSSVFKDLYDKISASARWALYEWMTLILQKSYNFSKSNASSSWVSAESLWIMGRYMVHLPLETIQNIDLNDIRLFISYDNATKQLDTVYDITPKHAEAFLERIDSSGFDMRNVTTLYRLGLLVCFYDIFQHMDASLAQVLLHQMIKCNQLRGFHAEVQKVKSLLLDIAMLNQNLNETLGSLSDAVVGLTLGQLESLLPEAVQNSILTLQQVSGWTKSQSMILAGKFLNSEKVLSFHNVSQMGELVSGIGTQSFYNMSPKELAHIVKGGLSQYAADLSSAQQEAILDKVLEFGNITSAATGLQGVFFEKVPLSILFKQHIDDPSALKDRELRRSQALFLYESLSKKTTPDELLSTGHLIKGVTCQHIDNMKTPTFLQSFKVFENNLHLLSPYQMTCLAWKFWKVASTSIPPYLLLMLPVEYLQIKSPPPCVPFLISLQKIELDSLIFHEKKKKAIIDRVQQCLNGSVGDGYDVDLLGKLICHLSPAIIQNNISPKAMATAIQQFKLCEKLSMAQKIQIKNRLIEIYGNPKEWAVETILDHGAFLALLSKEEFSTLAIKFPNPVLQIASKISGASLTDEIVSALFDAVSDYSPRANSSDQRAECIGVRAPSSGDILKLGEANACWSIQELECMDTDTFTKNVELFGSIKRFNTSQLIIVKEKAKEVWGALANWKSYHIVSLGRIALALNSSEIEELDLSSLDTVVALSQQTEWTTDQAEAIFKGVLKDSHKLVSDLKSIDLVGLGTNICAIDFKEIPSIKTSEFSVVIARIGSLPCGTPVLREFKKKAERVFGMSEKWNSSVLHDIGIIAAGLSREDVRALRKDLMPFIHPSAIQVMPEDVFKHLSPEQIAHLGPENAAMVSESQRLHLSTTQLQSLQQTIDGARIMVQDPQITARTTTPTEVLVSNGALCSSSSGAKLYISFLIGLLKFAEGMAGLWSYGLSSPS